MTFHDVFQRNGLLFTAADPFQRAFRQINVVGLGAPGPTRKLLEAGFRLN